MAERILSTITATLRGETVAESATRQVLDDVGAVYDLIFNHAPALSAESRALVKAHDRALEEAHALLRGGEGAVVGVLERQEARESMAASGLSAAVDELEWDAVREQFETWRKGNSEAMKTEKEMVERAEREWKEVVGEVQQRKAQVWARGEREVEAIRSQLKAL